MTTGPPLLSVSRLGASYDGVRALWDVSLEVPEGSVVAIIGSNGAGKTTLLNAISGIVPAAGEVTFAGQRIDRASAEGIVRAGISQVPEGRQIFGSLTVEENLLVGAHTVPDGQIRASRLREVYDLFPRLEERRRQEGATLSGGEQQMLAIGRALMAGPRLLMLDEPSLGLSPVLVGSVFRTIAYIRERGTTVLLVEQNSRMALRHSDAAYVLDVGRVVLSGPSAQLQTNENVRRVYLGEELLTSS